MIDRPSWVSCRVTVSPPNMILLRGASRLEAIRWWPDGIVKEEITDLTVQFGLYPRTLSSRCSSLFFFGVAAIEKIPSIEGGGKSQCFLPLLARDYW